MLQFGFYRQENKGSLVASGKLERFKWVNLQPGTDHIITELVKGSRVRVLEYALKEQGMFSVFSVQSLKWTPCRLSSDRNTG